MTMLPSTSTRRTAAAEHPVGLCYGWRVSLRNPSRLLPVSAATAPNIGLAWLVRLRWLAIWGQLGITTLALIVLRVSLPLGAIAALIAVTALSNLAISWWRRQSEPWAHTLLAFQVLDVLTLTGLLLTAGGAANPFSVFYLVHVALSALLLPPRQAWLLAGLTSLAFGALFVLPSHSIDAHAMHMQHGASALHLQGMWLAYTLAAAFVVHFVSRVASALQAREREVFALQRSAAQSEKLASLSTLAAGAAHELGTPLSTIALVAKELERGLEQGAASQDLAPDARLIRQEVERCRNILQQMAASAGESAGEMPVSLSIPGLERSLAEALGPTAKAIDFERAGELTELVAPKELLVKVLANLVRNAFDAQAETGTTAPVRMISRIEPAQAAFEILDCGAGISEHALARLGEPFFTTKPPGRGLGLGVFLARAFAEKVGGELAFAQRPGGGTVVRLIVPTNMLETRAHA